MTDILRKILLPQLQFEGAENPEKFLRTFADLYRIELFKDGLDLILTKVQAVPGITRTLTCPVVNE